MAVIYWHSRALLLDFNSSWVMSPFLNPVTLSNIHFPSEINWQPNQRSTSTLSPTRDAGMDSPLLELYPLMMMTRCIRFSRARAPNHQFIMISLPWQHKSSEDSAKPTKDTTSEDWRVLSYCIFQERRQKWPKPNNNKTCKKYSIYTTGSPAKPAGFRNKNNIEGEQRTTVALKFALLKSDCLEWNKNYSVQKNNQQSIKSEFPFLNSRQEECKELSLSRSNQSLKKW